jgi:hypothetical protein
MNSYGDMASPGWCNRKLVDCAENGLVRSALWFDVLLPHTHLLNKILEPERKLELISFKFIYFVAISSIATMVMRWYRFTQRKDLKSPIFRGLFDNTNILLVVKPPSCQAEPTVIEKVK